MRPLSLHSAPPDGATLIALRDDDLRLPAGDVAIWCVKLDQQPPETFAAMRSLLSADEASRAQSFYFERDRQRYVVGRGILRILIGAYVGAAPEKLAFSYGPNGKPALRAQRHAATRPLFFNVAHSEGLALFAFTRSGEIGIDVECMRELPDWQQVAEAVFSPQELANLRACEPAQRRDEFFRAWTRQEAVLKALGTGLGDVRAAGAQTAFNVYPLHVAEGFAAALAAVPASEWTSFHLWPSQDRLDPANHRRSPRVRLDEVSATGPNFL